MKNLESYYKLMEYFLENNMKKPLLSIITASYNSEKTISRTIKSLLNQSFLNFEYIIVDGKSSDKTVEIINSFKKKFDQKGIEYQFISEKDSGIYDAFNKGIKLANGNWISFLGSDDFYVNKALELYSNEIKNLKEEVDFIHSNVKVENKKIIKNKWLWKEFKRKMNIAHVGAFHSAIFFKKYGYFDTKYRIAGDYELLLRPGNNLKPYWFNEVTAIMSDNGISNRNVIEVYKETTKVKIDRKTQSVFLSKIDYLFWVFKYYMKLILNEGNR